MVNEFVLCFSRVIQFLLFYNLLIKCFIIAICHFFKAIRIVFSDLFLVFVNLTKISRMLFVNEKIKQRNGL